MAKGASTPKGPALVRTKPRTYVELKVRPAIAQS